MSREIIHGANRHIDFRLPGQAAAFDDLGREVGSLLRAFEGGRHSRSAQHPCATALIRQCEAGDGAA
jgi:hypothetical protein